MAVQDYIDHVLAALPKWFSRKNRDFENVKAFAEIFQKAQDQSDFWKSQSYIGTAVGPLTGEPDWLNQHATDRGTRRQENETDEALRDRLRTFPDALNLATLLATAQSVIDAESISGTVYILELRPNRAFLVDLTSQTGTGGVFAKTGSTMYFTPDACFANLSLFYDTVTGHKLTISGAASAGNDGTFVVTGIVGDALEYTNASGVAETDATVSWEILRVDAAGNTLDGFRQSYMNRGYRMGLDRSTIVVILPYGCTEATRLSVIEALRLKKAAGVRVIVECRANP